MPFKNDDLSVLAFAKDFTLWHYRSPDTAIAEGYFDQADEMLASGDMILANLGQGAESRVGIYLVTANAAGSVSFDDLSCGAEAASA